MSVPHIVVELRENEENPVALANNTGKPDRTYMRLVYVRAFLALCCWSSDCHAAELPFPLSFNRGSWSPEVLESAKKIQIADERPSAGGGIVVRHARIEVFEGSKLTSRSRQTVFALCESLFYPNISGQFDLSKLTINYVVLDYQGRLQTDGSYILAWAQDNGTWKKSSHPGPNAKAFHAQLPRWAQDILHTVSGYLEKKPGLSVVSFERTNAESLGGVLKAVLDVSPTPAFIKSAIGEVIYSVIKGMSVEELNRALRNDDLRWGYADRIEQPDVTSDAKRRELYRQTGAKMWTF